MLKKITIYAIIFSFAAYALSKDDFTHTLNLAKNSACKDVAEVIQKIPRLTKVEHPEYSLGEGCPIGRGGSLQSKLKALNSSPFPYRFEITNGYQEGFVYYALLGYSSEQNGDIPFAYRCYQNSLACIDEDKSFSHPLPRAEIYLAIGRTCLAAGRYMDAKNWLDNAFLEAGDNLQLQAAIDRVLIRRANEIGDYPEIIFLYQHLEELAGGQKTEDGEQKTKDELANDKKSPPLLKGDTGGFKNTNGKVELTKDGIANYAQILFYTKKDREGFGKLLEGISKYGIDNNLGFKDPLLDKFFHNILRANEDEVSQFYDSLQYALADARALKGDEDYLIQLLEARKMMCRAYDFLQPEEDLAVIKQRINKVKKTLDKTKQLPNPVKRNVQRKQLKRPITLHSKKVSRFSKVRSAPETLAETALMNAELLYMSGKTNETVAECLKLLKKTKNKKIRQQIYDGTTWENAVRMLAVSAYLDLKGTTQWSRINFDNSHRSETLRAKLMANGLMSYESDEGLPKLPYYNPALISSLEYRAKKICEKERDAAAILALENALQNRTFLFDLYPLLVSRYVRKGDIEAGFKAIKNRRSEDLYNNISSADFWIFWKIIADVTDEQFKQINQLWKRRNLLKHCGRNSAWKYNPYNMFLREEKIRFGNEEERKIGIGYAFIVVTHPHYIEQSMKYSSEWSYQMSNGFVCLMIRYLPSLVRDYPPERIIPIIKITRKMFKDCKIKYIRGELAVIYQGSREKILPPPIMVLPVEHVEKAPEFLDKLEEYLKKRDSK